MTIYKVTAFLSCRVRENRYLRDPNASVFIFKEDDTIIDSEDTARRVYQMYQDRLAWRKGNAGYFGQAMLFRTEINSETGFVLNTPLSDEDVIEKYTLHEGI